MVASCVGLSQKPCSSPTLFSLDAYFFKNYQDKMFHKRNNYKEIELTNLRFTVNISVMHKMCTYLFMLEVIPNKKYYCFLNLLLQILKFY